MGLKMSSKVSGDSRKRCFEPGPGPGEVDELAQFPSAESGQSKDRLEGFPFQDLPFDIQELILSFLPYRTLERFRRVCHNWQAMVDNRQGIWSLKCNRIGRYWPDILLNLRAGADLPLDYKTLYIKNPYARNLIKNPCGVESFNYWETSDNDRWVNRGLILENAVFGAAAGIKEPNTLRLPDEEVLSKAKTWVTSYGLGWIKQTVDLIDCGVSSKILDEIKPGICVSAWCAPRWDCASEFHITADLLDDKKVSKKSFVDSREYPQWNPAAWELVSNTFTNYPSGVRFVRLKLSGKDKQFWAGHYGTKFTGASVTLDWSTVDELH